MQSGSNQCLWTLKPRDFAPCLPVLALNGSKGSHKDHICPFGGCSKINQKLQSFPVLQLKVQYPELTVSWASWDMLCGMMPGIKSQPDTLPHPSPPPQAHPAAADMRHTWLSSVLDIKPSSLVQAQVLCGG